MSDGYLSVEHGHVRLGDTLLPGVFVSMDVADSVKIDCAKMDNMSGKKKIPMGWEDSLLTIEMDLVTDDSTCYDKLAKVNYIFKGMDSQSNPKILKINNPHAAARGVDKVLFRTLRSRETSDDDVIRVTLEFDEHDPPTIPPELRAKSTSADNTTPGMDSTDVSADPDVTADTLSPFDRGYSDSGAA